MNSFFSDLKAFLMKGNVIDLAVAVIIGAAFKAIVSSFVDDIIMPPIGLLIGGVDFSNLSFVLQEASGDVAEVAIRYGSFIQKVIDFIIMGTTVFVVIKAYENMQKKEEPPEQDSKPPEDTKDQVLLTEIRDLLAKDSKTTTKV
jgi:large conductance mechanosensitive channel